jgi:hypothetical protein
MMSMPLQARSELSISEERLQLLLPRDLKSSAQRRAKRIGVSLGEYIRRLIEADLRGAVREPAVEFPFGDHPISTGRTHGSVDHDRP